MRYLTLLMALIGCKSGIIEIDGDDDRNGSGGRNGSVFNIGTNDTGINDTGTDDTGTDDTGTDDTDYTIDGEPFGFSVTLDKRFMGGEEEGVMSVHVLALRSDESNYFTSDDYWWGWSNGVDEACGPAGYECNLVTDDTSETLSLGSSAEAIEYAVAVHYEDGEVDTVGRPTVTARMAAPDAGGLGVSSNPQDLRLGELWCVFILNPVTGQVTECEDDIIVW